MALLWLPENSKKGGKVLQNLAELTVFYYFYVQDEHRAAEAEGGV